MNEKTYTQAADLLNGAADCYGIAAKLEGQDRYEVFRVLGMASNLAISLMLKKEMADSKLLRDIFHSS